MKKANLTIIATIIAAFGITIFAFQPTTEAENIVLPSATPSPRKKRPPVAIQSPRTIQVLKQPSSSRTNKPSGIMQDYYAHSNIRSKVPKSGKSVKRKRVHKPIQ